MLCGGVHRVWVFLRVAILDLQHHLAQLRLGQVHLVVLLLQKIFQVLDLKFNSYHEYTLLAVCSFGRFHMVINFHENMFSTRLM